MPPRGTTNAAEGQNAQLQNQNRQAGQQLHVNQPLEANRQEPVEVNQMKPGSRRYSRESCGRSSSWHRTGFLCLKKPS